MLSSQITACFQNMMMSLEKPCEQFTSSFNFF